MCGQSAVGIARGELAWPVEDSQRAIHITIYSDPHASAAMTQLGHLKGVTDPEAKRKIIGHVFVEVFQREAKKMRNAKCCWLKARSAPT